jgi:hypothetical protein
MTRFEVSHGYCCAKGVFLIAEMARDHDLKFT